MSATVEDLILSIWDPDLTSPAQAEQKFRAALTSSNPPWSESDKGQLLTQLARSVGLQRRFDEANKLLDEAAALYDRLKNAPTSSTDINILHIRLILERGRVLNTSGSSAESVPLFQEAVDCAQSPASKGSGGHFDPVVEYLLVDALHMLAIVAPTVLERFAFATAALKLAEKSPDRLTKHWAGPLLNNLGWDAVDEGEFADAVGYFRRAEVIRKEELDRVSSLSPQNDSLKQRAFTAWKIGVWSIGHAQMLQRREDEAFEMLTGLLKASADGPAIRADLASICAKRGDKEAAVHAKKALEFGLDETQSKEMEELVKQWS